MAGSLQQWGKGAYKYKLAPRRGGGSAMAARRAWDRGGGGQPNAREKKSHANFYIKHGDSDEKRRKTPKNNAISLATQILTREIGGGGAAKREIGVR